MFEQSPLKVLLCAGALTACSCGLGLEGYRIGPMVLCAVLIPCFLFLAFTM